MARRSERPTCCSKEERGLRAPATVELIARRRVIVQLGEAAEAIVCSEIDLAWLVARTARAAHAAAARRCWSAQSSTPRYRACNALGDDAEAAGPSDLLVRGERDLQEP